MRGAAGKLLYSSGKMIVPNSHQLSRQHVTSCFLFPYNDCRLVNCYFICSSGTFAVLSAYSPASVFSVFSEFWATSIQ